ncbi:hypothetical protein [Parabacteroides sp.]
MRQDIENISNSVLAGNNISGNNNIVNNQEYCESIPQEKTIRWCYISFVISILAIITAVVFSCLAYPRITTNNDPGMDYLGMIIGILSFLLAVLAIMFGYNIFDIKNRIKEQVSNEVGKTNTRIDKEAHDINERIDKIELELNKLRESILGKKIYINGNIIIKTKKFRFKDLIAYANESHAKNAEIINGNLIIDDDYIFNPNAIYYASGDIVSYVVGNENEEE